MKPSAGIRPASLVKHPTLSVSQRRGRYHGGPGEAGCDDHAFPAAIS